MFSFNLAIFSLRTQVFCTFCIALSSLGVVSAAELDIRFNYLWRGQPFDFAAEDYQTQAGETIRITRLAYLLSHPRLHHQEVNLQPLESLNWFGFVEADSKENERAGLVLKNLPKGTYKGLSFTVGVNDKTNQSNPNQYAANHALNPLVNNLHWTPQGGYIFMALEGVTKDGRAFAYHLGNPGNQLVINLPFPTQIDFTETHEVVINFHIDRLFDNKPFLDSRLRSSTHSRRGDPMVDLLKRKLGNAFEIKAVNLGSSVDSEAKEYNTENPLVGTPYRLAIPKIFPIPNLPRDFPITNERVALGKDLFHESLLSRDGSISCASCHDQQKAFTDGLALSKGIEDRTGTRNSMSLLNLAWKSNFFWDGSAPSLRELVHNPIEDHREMDESMERVLTKLAESKKYPKRFRAAFGDSKITAERLEVAIEQFLLTLTSYNSDFDLAMRGKSELSESAKRGFQLFMTEFDPKRGLRGADCFHCHGGAFFSDFRFHNNGLKPTDDIGLAAVSGKATDQHKFVTPSLRNVELTAPYMHDGRFDNLEAVIEHYRSGIHRSTTLDPNLGKHAGNGIVLSETDKADLVAFLKSLTDRKKVKPLLVPEVK